jgi:catechol-2,3-dioxygenase
MPPVASKTSSKPILWHRDEDFKAGTVNGIHPPTYGATLGGIRGPITTSGFHHIALVCKNMKEQIKFYECAMGMKLRAIYPMVSFYHSSLSFFFFLIGHSCNSN